MEQRFEEFDSSYVKLKRMQFATTLFINSPTSAVKIQSLSKQIYQNMAIFFDFYVI